MSWTQKNTLRFATIQLKWKTVFTKYLFNSIEVFTYIMQNNIVPKQCRTSIILFFFAYAFASEDQALNAQSLGSCRILKPCFSSVFKTSISLSIFFYICID